MASAARELNSVIGQVMTETGVQHREIVSRARMKIITQARHRAMALLRAKKWTLQQIADALDCDKAAVRYGLKQEAARAPTTHSTG